MFNPLDELRNLGPEAVIVGSGPTRFDYRRLMYVTSPVFFINRAHALARFCRSKKQYFVTHHISQYRNVPLLRTIFIEQMWYEEGRDYAGHMSARVYPEGPYIPVKCQADDEVLTAEFFVKYPQLLDREFVAMFSRLVAGFGSATTAIHAAWFSGCQKLTMIGCNPDCPDNGYDLRLGQDLGEMAFAPEKVKENNRNLPGLLGMRVRYL